MTDLMAPGRFYHPDDHVIMEVDIEDCPVADVPLTEIFDTANSLLIDDYISVLKTYIVQQLEDTIWLDDQSTTPLFDAGFATFHRKTDGTVQSLRKPALQRLIDQSIRDRPNIANPIGVKLLIRFQIPISKLPRQSHSPPTVPSVIGGQNEEDERSDRRESRAGLSGLQSSAAPQESSTSSAEQDETNASLRFTGPPLLDDVAENTPAAPATGRNTMTGGASFRGSPVDVPQHTTRVRAEDTNHTSYLASTEPRGPRGRLVFQADETGTPRTQYTQASGRTMNSHAPITSGAESFEDYMRQFMSSEVRYKDFRKTIVPKYDSSRQDSFIHWYKLFCATCLQWGLWCPPYESVEQDNIHGSWWMMLPASVRAQDTFMSSLLYGVLSQETVFPVGSKEHSAVQGCAANAGYDAIYSLLRLHHPRLQAALHTVNEIPRQRRAELFSSYLRRLQDFMARERIAGRNYSEYEALDLSVRNLAAEWRSEFRRLVERDRRTGRTSDTLPFHLTMSQLATTFVQYSIEIGRDVTAPPPSNTKDRYSSSAQIVRRIDTAPLSPEALSGTADSLGEQEMDLLIRAMSHNQAHSDTCLGCRQTGHTLTDCNRFVDYIVAESLAQRHPQLKNQVAAAHSQFRSRLNIRNADGRPPSGARTVRSILSRPSSDSAADMDQPSHPTHVSSSTDEEDASPDGYQLNALRGSFPISSDDFELCFADADLHSCDVPVASFPFFESVCSEPLPLCLSTDIPAVDSDSFLFRRLSETYDPTSRSVFAHADNGSMACTTSDATLLFSYRTLTGSSTKVRLFDAGSHSHHPDGVGFLCLPAYRAPPLSTSLPSDDVSTFTPCCVFVRTYHTASIPGVIISHCAIAKQLSSDGYSMTSSEDRVGMIRFPARVSLPTSADICISLQPTRLRGGLTFTESLLIPSSADHVAPLPCGPHRYIVNSLAHIVAPLPPYFPSSSIVPTVPPGSLSFPEFSAAASPLDQAFLINALGRSALRMLWHQRLGHLNFRRLSELHKHTRGIPAFSLPDVIDECAVCMASKLRKTPRGHTNTMTATTCLQGLGIDFAFMVQRSSDTKRFDNLVGHNGETCYVLITDHFSGRLVGRAFATKAPPVDWLNQWLANNAPPCANKYVRMDGGGELGRCREILDTFANFGYQTQLTGPDSSHQNGPGERPHQTIGDALRAMLTGANLRAAFWPYAFYHFLRLYNFVPHGSRVSSPHEMCGGELPDLSKLRTFGCRVHVRPTTSRYGRVVPNSRLGIFLGYSRTLKILYYFDLASSLVKTATHARFDEGMNDLVDAPPNVQALRLLSPDGRVPADRPILSPLNLVVTDDPFHRLDSITQTIKCDHPTLGFEISECHIRKRGYLSGIVASTSAARIRNVRRKYIGAYIVSVDDVPVFSCDSVVAALTAVVASDAVSFTIVFAPDRYIPVSSRPNDSPLHLSVDQLRLVASLRAPSAIDAPPPVPNAAAPEPRTAIMHEPLPHDQLLLLMRSLNTTAFGTEEEQALGSFTRRKLKRLSNWSEWLLAEAKQLDSMAKQGMYGTAVPPPAGAIILRQHWNYSIKSDGTRKARNCCDGSPRAAPDLKLANTYSSCIEQPCMRMFFALCAHEGYFCVKVDATNAYANSPPPDQPTYVHVDHQYADWFLIRNDEEVPLDYVLPVQHALQGHPESGALWERFINKVLHRHGFKSTTHERSLYHGTYDGWKMLISRQVDDLAIGCRNTDSIRKLVAIICAEDKIDLRDEGILTSFNGVDVIQSRHYIQVTCESYIDRFLEHYGWSSPGNRESSERPIEPIAMSTIPQLFLDYDAAAASTEAALMEHEINAGFSYRSILGCVIYVYVVARIDIGFAVTLLARFSDHPVKIHFDSLRRLARYLRMTKDWGLIYWRPAPIEPFPPGNFVVLLSDPSLPDFPQPQSSTSLAGYVDAAHATDLSTRRSITGLAFMLCGGPIAYKSKVQSTVSTSSTEAEFVAAVQAAKIAKYLRSILLELDYAQPGPTVLYEDNQAAILMINASRPTPRSRHIDIQHFAIQEWKSNGDIILCHIPGIINPADALTKALGTTLHFRHVRRLMGHYGAPWMSRG